jgi:hypothetical protein
MVSFLRFAGKPKRHGIVIIVDSCASIYPDVEGLVKRHQERDSVRHRLAVDGRVVHRQDTHATLAGTRSVGLEVDSSMSRYGARGPKTAVGLNASVPVPLPISPSELRPQQ